jgi:hypothetical protein
MSMPQLHVNVHAHVFVHADYSNPCSTDMDMQQGHDMQQRHGHAAWKWYAVYTGTCSMDMDMQHGHGHAA